MEVATAFGVRKGEGVGEGEGEGMGVGVVSLVDGVGASSDERACCPHPTATKIRIQTVGRTIPIIVLLYQVCGQRTTGAKWSGRSVGVSWNRQTRQVPMLGKWVGGEVQREVFRNYVKVCQVASVHASTGSARTDYGKAPGIPYPALKRFPQFTIMGTETHDQLRPHQ